MTTGPNWGSVTSPTMTSVPGSAICWTATPVISASRELGIGMIPYTPLALGILTGKYQRGEEPPPGTRAAAMQGVRKKLTDAKLDAVDRLRPWAEERGHTTAELALAWLLSFPEVSTVIVGARTPEQVEANTRAIGWKLTPEERDEVARLAQGPS